MKTMYVFNLFKVCHISCGDDFTAFLTLDGGVFTCGAGEYGQTGHGNTKDELVPRKVSNTCMDARKFLV